MSRYSTAFILIVIPVLSVFTGSAQGGIMGGDTNLALFGRGLYPGDDSTFECIKASGFTTVILSSFYIHADGDVYSGDDKDPIIHNGRYSGSQEWRRRVNSLKQGPGSVRRIELLLEGRWYHQPPNTFDFIQDWTDSSKTVPAITTGTGSNSTLYKIAKALKDELGIDAICIDDESVYDSASIVRLGAMLHKLNMHMTLCPFTKPGYWKSIIDGSQQGLVDAIYVQCYDGGAANTPGQWNHNLATTIPVYPVFMCRGAYGTCASSHNSKTPAEIKAEMARFKKDYPGMMGGAIWQIADIKGYAAMNCAVQYPASGSAGSISQYMGQLKDSLKDGL